MVDLIVLLRQSLDLIPSRTKGTFDCEHIVLGLKEILAKLINYWAKQAKGKK